jgi:hypothetical protein
VFAVFVFFAMRRTPVARQRYLCHATAHGTVYVHGSPSFSGSEGSSGPPQPRSARGENLNGNANNGAGRRRQETQPWERTRPRAERRCCRSGRRRRGPNQRRERKRGCFPS